MKSVDESIVEQASLEWLAGLGYTSIHGDDLSPGGQHAVVRLPDEDQEFGVGGKLTVGVVA